MNSNLNNLNRTPLRTKSWLNVNDVTIKNFDIPEIRDFNGFNIASSHSEGFSIGKLTENNIIPLIKNFKYGVSNELITEGESKFNQGYVIKIKRNSTVKTPIVLEFNFDKYNQTLIDNITIVAEENSSGTIIIKYKSLDNSIGYHNGLCKIFAKENSNINIIKVNLLNNKTLNLDSNLSDISYGGHVDFVEVNLGGSHSITNYHGDLREDNSSSTLNSLYLGANNKIIDMNYIMTHTGRRSSSEIITKGALKDTSTKVFKGTLDFKRGSSKSTGKEDEYCMILSPKVTAKALPLLLCEEDDISGEHAAGSGKIDENKLFYLMTRGLSYEESRRVIIEGTFNPIIDKIHHKPLKEEIILFIKECLDNE